MSEPYQVCGFGWAGGGDHSCRHELGHPGRHVCRCRSWQPGVSRMSVSSPVGGNTLREDLFDRLDIAIHDVLVDNTSDHEWASQVSLLIADAVLAVVAPHLDAAEAALGKVRALADEWEAKAHPFGALCPGCYGCLRPRAIRAALASAEATADTQETP